MTPLDLASSIQSPLFFTQASIFKLTAVNSQQGLHYLLQGYCRVFMNIGRELLFDIESSLFREERMKDVRGGISQLTNCRACDVARTCNVIEHARGSDMIGHRSIRGGAQTSDLLWET